MSDEEIDFEFELDQEVLKQLEEEERQYLSQVPQGTQLSRVAPQQTQEHEEYIVNRPRVLDTPERDKNLVQELKYKLQISENTNKRLKDQVKNSEEKITKAKIQAVKNKTSTQQDQSKRRFPGLPVPEQKSKTRKVEPLSQAVTLLSPTTQGGESSPSSVKFISPSQTNNQIESKLDRTETSNRPLEQTLLRYKSKNYESVTIYNQTETVDNLQLLRILFASIFKEWNKDQENPRNFNMSLTPTRIKEFSQAFSEKFVPSPESCTATAASRLGVLASEIDYIVSRSVNAETTIRSLFSQFGFCLSIYIEEKLCGKIQLLCDIIERLVSKFYPAKDLLYKELIVDKSNSILYKLGKSLSLFPFSKTPEGYRIIEEYPDIGSSNYMEIMGVAEKYNTYPSIFNAALRYEKAPVEALPAVTSILGIFTCIGRYSLKSVFKFLVVEKGFLQLLSLDTPFTILNQTLSVLETTVIDDNWKDMSLQLEAKDHIPCDFIGRITSLLSIPQYKQNERDWYCLRGKLLAFLGQTCLIELQPSVLVCIQKWIYSKIVELLVECTFFEPRKEKITTNKEQERLVTKGLEIIYTIVKLNPPNLFKFNIEHTENQLAGLVLHFIEQTGYTDPIILDLYETMENYICTISSQEPMDV